MMICLKNRTGRFLMDRHPREALWLMSHNNTFTTFSSFRIWGKWSFHPIVCHQLFVVSFSFSKQQLPIIMTNIYGVSL